MASLLCVRNHYFDFKASLTMSYKLRKALGSNILKYLPVLHSRLLDLVPIRDLRTNRSFEIHNPGFYSSTSNADLSLISTLPRQNLSVPNPSIPPLPRTWHTPLQRHGENISRLTHMYGDNSRRPQRSLRRPARLLRLQVPPGQRHLHQHLLENRHRPQTISEKKRDQGPDFQASGRSITGKPSEKEQNRPSAIRPSRRAPSAHKNPAAQPAIRHRAPHPARPSDRSERPRFLLLALARQAESL